MATTRAHETKFWTNRFEIHSLYFVCISLNFAAQQRDTFSNYDAILLRWLLTVSTTTETTTTNWVRRSSSTTLTIRNRLGVTWKTNLRSDLMHKATEPVSVFSVFCLLQNTKRKLSKTTIKEVEGELQQQQQQQHYLFKYRINNLQKSKLSILPSKFRRTQLGH